MQGAGGMGSIARLMFEAGARGRSSLRSGQVIRAQVIKQLAPSKWMLGIGGRVVAASSERALSPGMIFEARVRIEAGVVYLQPPEAGGGQEAVQRFLGAEGLPRDELSVTILRALLRSGMPLDPGAIRNAYAFFKHRDSVSARRVRVYLLMQQKGLFPSQEGLDRVLDALDGYGGGGAQGGSRDDAHKRDRGERESAGRRENSRDALREIVERRDEEAYDIIHAFNHLPTEGGHWIVVPFSLQGAGGQGYRGSIRIHFSGLPPAVNRPTVDRAAVSAEGERGRWEFELRRDGSSAARVFYPAGDVPPPDLLADLTERLRALGFSAVETEPAGNFDGFSTGESVDILRGIDTEA